MEYDGVVVEDTSHLQRKAWQQVAEEEGRPVPPLFALQRAEGMKNDQVLLPLLLCRCSPRLSPSFQVSRDSFQGAALAPLALRECFFHIMSFVLCFNQLQ